jgi:L-rhamnose mutarotase
MSQNLKLLQIIFFFLLIVCITPEAKDDSTVKMESEKVTKRVGSLIKVKPEYEERYIILHKYTFPGVLDRIRKSNIRNYSIFLLDGILFSHYEYVGNDFDADMKAIADPTTEDWWKLTDPMQEPLPTRKEGEWWAEMEQFLVLEKKIKPSPGAQRIGIVAEVIRGKEEELRILCQNFPADLEEETNKKKFQNANLYYKDGKVYYYYEYVGNDIGKSFAELNKIEKFNAFQSEMNKFLVPDNNAYWKNMKEVFHTD